nr:MULTISPECIES: hypothetical protein [unclassified Rhizobium]
MKLIPEVVGRIRELKRSYSIKLRTGSYQEIGDYILHGKADIGISRLRLDERIFEWRPVGTPSIYSKGSSFRREGRHHARGSCRRGTD